MSDVARPIFAIFEGGGAKGVAHVGAVAAAEANGLTIVGVAGASAGAIVAALVAVGLKASDLIDRQTPGGDILTRNGSSPVKLLGEREWRELQHLIKYAPKISLRPDWHGWMDRLATPPRLIWNAAGIAMRKGHLSTEGVREFLNAELHCKLTVVRAAHGVTEPLPDRVRFEHLDDEAFKDVLPLKIVGTNTTTRELWIFDRRLTPKVEVAEAVAASIAIPFAFKPVMMDIDGRACRFVDGGLVSNLPIWIFANEKLAYERNRFRDPPVPIIGFTLRDKPKPAMAKGKPGLFGYARDLVLSSLAGSQAIAEGFIQDLTVVTLETSLETLQFGASEQEMFGAYDDGYRCADAALREALIAKPDLVRAELQRIHDRVRIALRAGPGRRWRGRWTLRANLVERRGTDAFRVTYGYNMHNDADDRLALDSRGRGAPAAFLRQDMLHAAVGKAWSQPDKDYMTKYERALVRPGIKSIICIPIYQAEDVWLMDSAARPKPAGVLSLDSDRDLSAAFQDDEFRWLLATQSTLLYELMRQEPSRG